MSFGFHVKQIILAMSVFSFVLATFLFGEMTTPLDGVPPWLKDASAVGVLVWYLWYTQTRTIPQIVKDGQDTNKHLADSFGETSKHQVQAFREEMASERERHERTIDRLAETWKPKP